MHRLIGVREQPERSAGRSVPVLLQRHRLDERADVRQQRHVALREQGLLVDDEELVTPATAARRTRMCCSGVNGFFRKGMTTSWMKMLPQEWR